VGTRSLYRGGTTLKFLLSRVAVLSGTVLLFGLVFAGTAAASDGSRVQVIQLQDRCDPVTFNAAGIACIARPDGKVQLQTLLNFISAKPAAVLDARNALGWRFQPDHADIKAGTTLIAANVGGEVHTFTEVTDTGFVNSCVPQVAPIFAKVLPAPTAAECATLAPPNVNPDSTLVFPVGFPGNPRTTLASVENDTGTELYQCLIHPWMRLTLQVKKD
jgi:plastocyanin